MCQRYADEPIPCNAPFATCALSTNTYIVDKGACCIGQSMTYPHRFESSVDVAATPTKLIAEIDDPSRLSAQITGSSMLMDRRNTILLAGFQAGGTRGAALNAGAHELKIHGQLVPVRAEVASLDMFSAHADRDELMRWLHGFEAPPRMTFVTHGELKASDSFRRSIKDGLEWTARVPEHGERVELS